jgi:hypothetical protein
MNPNPAYVHAKYEGSFVWRHNNNPYAEIRNLLRRLPKKNRANRDFVKAFIQLTAPELTRWLRLAPEWVFTTASHE